MIWVVVGASSAIAREFARQAAKDGAGILLAGRDTADLEAGRADIAVRTGAPCRALAFDIADASEHENLIDAARDLAAGGTINVFLAAGTMPAQNAIDADPGLAAATIVTNYTGAVLLLQPVLCASPEPTCLGHLGLQLLPPVCKAVVQRL